ncbi:PocR ligand-binding domain-containing protein [Carboxylicivirga sp. RSCT41]|uniref:PocR ligand-binding domain-containing protein n=1 Tax=Carboxylicivirga agarovorans TaxID=3417570 RepID=UPI003D338CA8
MKGNKILHRIIDLATLQELFESFHALCGIPITLTDVNGGLLYKPKGEHIGAGWIKACTHYHRQCEQTNKNCIISDTYLARHLKSGKEHAIYTCLNGLVDLAVPVYWEGEHIANIFSGQFFMSEPDISFYESLADKYGFNRSEYLAEIENVQRFDEAKVQEIIRFLKSLASLVTKSIQNSEDGELPLTKSKQLDKLTADSRRRDEILTTTLLSLDDYIYSLDTKDCFEEYYTPFKVGLLEEDYKNIKGLHYSQLNIHPQIKDELCIILEKVKRSKKTHNFYFPLKKNGHVEEYKGTVAYRRNAFNRFGGTTLHIRNISYEAKAYNEVTKLKQIIDNSPVAIVITDSDANIEYVNEQFCQNTGYTPTEVLGQNPRILKSGITPEGTYETLWRQISQGLTWKGGFQNKRKDGSLFAEKCIISPYYTNGTISHYVAIKEDITEKLAMEKELIRYKNKLEERVVEKNKQLQKSQHDYKEIVEHLTGIVWEVNMQGLIRFVSPNILKYSDYSAEELIEQPISYLFNPELHGKLYEFVNQFPENPREFSDFEVFLDKAGKRTFFTASGKPIFDIDNQLIGIRGISIDVTQQRERDKQVVEAIWQAEERLRTRISMELHDSIGATMSALSMYMNTLNTQFPDNSILQQVDSIVKKTASDIRMVARELNPPELETLGLAESLESISLLYNQVEQVNIKFLTDNLNLEPERNIKLALYRIITELINNAIKHGKATDIQIRLFSFEDEIYILYEDIGQGIFNNGSPQSLPGNGLKNIQTRLNTYGGHCQFFPIANCGLIVGMQLKAKSKREILT